MVKGYKNPTEKIPDKKLSVYFQPNIKTTS